MYICEYNPNYIVPDLTKYECFDCEKEFILSDAYNNSDAKCPYCQSGNIEEMATMSDDLLSELGCLAISVDRSWLEKQGITEAIQNDEK